LLPISETGKNSRYSADLFDRAGLPLLIVKCDISDLERAAALGSAPDRILVTAERGRHITEFSMLAGYSSRSSGTHQELAALIEPETSALKELVKAKAQWAYFSTDKIFSSSSLEEADAERARIISAAHAANRLKLRVALIGPVGRHLAPSLASVPYIEEMIPTPDLWYLALRAGWERAVSDFMLWMR
jgi:hypothetical protein